MLYAGLDLGQRQDHSAIAVVERLNLYRPHTAPAFHSLVLRHIERAPLGTPWSHIVKRVRQVARAGLAEGGFALAVDATGVGAPVVEMLRNARLGCDLIAVSVTSGDREHGSGALCSVPKQDLMSGLQLALEKGELQIPRHLPVTPALVQELIDVQITATTLGRLRIGADAHGRHDDLVFALALARWRAHRKTAGFGTQRLPGI